MRLAAAALTLGLLASPGAAENFTVELADSSRGNRTVSAIVCLPDGAAGTLYVFAHGFDCFAPDYMWLCGTPGIALASVISTGIPFLPDTKDLALDQAFLTKALPEANRTDPSSPLYGRLLDKVILGGHSMGGGTTVLAADGAFDDASYDAIAVLAPGLYTQPSGWPHAPALAKPILIAIGNMDCGPNQLEKTQLPLFRNATSQRKALVVVAGADHCGWTAAVKGVCVKPSKGNCSMVDREHEHAEGNALLAPFAAATVGRGKWSDFEAFLEVGEKAGRWQYLTQSTPGKTVRSLCPCV